MWFNKNNYMSKLVEQLRSVRIFNAHEFAGKGNVFISYSPAITGRGSRSAHYVVSRPGYVTDPNAHWQDYGHKTFTCWRGVDRPAAFEEAKTWAGARYKITEWARTPFGSWMSASFVKQRLAELLEIVKTKETTGGSGDSADKQQKEI